ncbi:MAG: 4-fold beta flower protein [Bacteroidota bacterium]
MNCITDSERNVVAYLHNMMIIDLQQEKVLGLVLGNCVFGLKKEPIGKLFNNVFRHLNGEIIALLDEEKLNSHPTKPIEKTFIIAAWRILNNVQNHTCIWIEENKKWNKDGLLFFLQQEK